MLRGLVGRVARKVERRNDGVPASTTVRPVYRPAPSLASAPSTQGAQPAQSISGAIASLAAEQASSPSTPRAHLVQDNESARASACGDTLVIGQEECIACGTCVENAETIFVLPDEAKAVVIAQQGPMDRIQDAIDGCPVACIEWTAVPQDVAQINDRFGRLLG